MKKQKILTITITAIFLWSAVWVLAGNVNIRQLRNDGLALHGSVNKESYVLGEPVTARFKFVNNGETTKTVPSGGVEVGSLKIFIADKENGEYKEYRGPGWGRERGRPLDLEPGFTHAYSEVTIQWNGKPRVSHLNENAAREVLKGKISTEYVFPEPGLYWIKGLSYFGEDFTPIDSAPIRIEVKTPEGDDLEVWNQIKGNKEIAYLLQNGAFNNDKTEAKQQLIEPNNGQAVPDPLNTHTPHSFIENAWEGALFRFATQEEWEVWHDRLVSAKSQGKAELLAEAKAMEKEIFASINHGVLSRTNQQFVEDVFWSHLFREPTEVEVSHWVGFLENQPPSVPQNRRRARMIDDFQLLEEFVALIYGIVDGEIIMPPTSTPTP